MAQLIDEEEAEFTGRDEKGLTPGIFPNDTEASLTKKSVFGFCVAAPIIGQVLAWAAYLLTSLIHDQGSMYRRKFQTIHDWQLGYLYLALWTMRLMRGALNGFANGARGAAKVDRPDQHVYKLMSNTEPLKSAPYVLLATAGAVGRFNRAQRVVFNTDETLSLFLAEMLAAGTVFGPVVLVLALACAFARITYARSYTKAAGSRFGGFAIVTLTEVTMHNLNFVIGIRSLFY